MPDANVVISGDASGALAAIAATQAAINALTGKTVKIGVDSSGLAQAARDAGAVQGAMDNVGKSADRAGRATRDMGAGARTTADHMGRAADEAERMRTHMAAVNNIMNGGASGAVQHAAGMREVAAEADNASRSMRALSSGAADTQKAIGAGGGGAGFRDMGAAARGTSVEVMGIYRNTRQAITAAGEAGSAFNTASGHTSQMGTDLARMGSQAGGAGSELAKVSRGSMELSKGADGVYRTIDAIGRLRDSGGGGGLMGAIGSAVTSDLNNLGKAADKAGGSARVLGMGALYATAGMGILAGVTAGVGLAGVAEDFAHNNQLMNAGSEAVRGFNKQFSAMRSETTAAGMPQMDGVKSSLAGVGKELASIGAANMGTVLQDVSQLGNATTQTMKQLAPAIPPAIGALTSLAGAALGAFGNSAPAIAGFADNITQHAGGIQKATEAVISDSAGIANAVVDTVSAAGTVDSAVKSVIQPGGKPGVQKLNDTLSQSMDRTLGVRRDPTSGGVSSMGNWGDYDFNGTGAPKPGSPAAAGYTAKYGAAGGPVPGSQTRAQAQQFARAGAYHPSPDASRYDGMTGAQIMTAERADVGLPPVGQPHYSGVGPRGPGSSVGAMPPSIASGLGMSGGSAMPAMLSSMQSAVAGGGGDTGAAMVKHVQKAVNVAAPAAAAGGASMGAAVNTGMAQGMNSSQTVVDTLTIKHQKHVIDIASAALGIHSPSREFDYLGQMTMAGFGQGIERRAASSFGALGSVLDTHQSMASKYSADYQGPGDGVTVSAPKSNQAMQYQSDLANRNIDAHNERAARLANRREDLQRGAIGMTHDERASQLAQGRAALHERALANLGVGGRSRPTGDVNPFAGDQAAAASRRAGLNAVINPFHIGAMGEARSQFSAHGEAMTQGVSAGIAKGTAATQAQVSLFSKGVQGQHKKDHGIHSPSTVFASDGMNMAAGVGVGFMAGSSSAISDISTAASQMNSALQGPMSDYGLQAGYTFVQGMADGVSREIKTSSFTNLGEPDNLNPLAMAALAATGLLRAGSGASTLKTASGATGTITLPAPQTIVVQIPAQQIVMDSQVVGTIADQRIEVALNDLGNASGTNL